VRVQLELGQIEANIRRLMALPARAGPGPPADPVGMIVIPQNRHEVDAFPGEVAGRGGLRGAGRGVQPRRFALSELLVGGGQGRVQACVLPFRELNVYSDGKAVLCCDDWNEEYVVGDLNTQSLEEIWRGEALTRARQAHSSRAGRAAGVREVQPVEGPGAGAVVGVRRVMAGRCTLDAGGALGCAG